MSDSASPAKNLVVKGKARKLNAPVSAEYDECSSSVIDPQGCSNTRGHSKTQPSLAMSGDTKSREEVARERNRLAQKRFRARQREKLEKQMEEISAKERERVDLLSEKKDILTTLKANAQLLTVRESLFRLYRADESPGPVREIAGPPEGGRELAALPASLGGNMASIVLQSGQGHLASAMTGQIESAEYTAQFVSDAEERRFLSLLSSAEQVQYEFEKRASVVAGMLQSARGSGNSDGLSGLRGDPAFVSAQQKMFSFLWGMFCVNPPLALVWFSKNSTIDEHKYAQAGKMLHSKLSPDDMQRLRKLHSAHSLQYEKRQAKLQMLMDKVQKTLGTSASCPEYCSSMSSSTLKTLQECTDAICEVAREEFSSIVPFGVAFSSEFDLIDLSEVICYVSPQIVDTYAMVSAMLREDLRQKSLQ